MEQAQKPAAEAEAEGFGGLGLVVEGGVVELELLERVAQLGIVLAVDREETAEDHGGDVAIARQRFGGRTLGAGKRIPHP